MRITKQDRSVRRYLNIYNTSQKKHIKTVQFWNIYLQFKITVFYLNIFLNVIYFTQETPFKLLNGIVYNVIKYFYFKYMIIFGSFYSSKNPEKCTFLNIDNNN